ncbi:hypothetical protein NM208_g4492 [Fusarium decemcellulare]|uniref:Uncharacterized protein n=1 Tax=Fusarium decemcellulare TaxID=57161 RepID=A0ACC1SKH2_9HYPO|nr:hypothetical protein NM208_g4492 [Fusarium decemcellulare]
MLCALCMSIFLNSADRGVHHKDRESVAAAAKNGCRICHHMNTQIQEWHSLPLRYEFRWQATICEIQFYQTNPESPSQQGFGYNQHWVVFADVDIAEQAPSGYDQFVADVTGDLESDPCRVRRDFPALRDIPNNTGHEDVAKLAKTWLQDCKDFHRCESVGGTRDTDWYPQRLIYVGDTNQPPRLILREEEHVEGGYAALSHCWGPNPQFTMLSSDTLEQFRDEIPLEELPASFRDAIITCRRLDIPYIWIDSLCILQHGEDSHADWLHNSEEMHRVYFNCELNIAIDVSKSPHEGAFRGRDPTFLQSCTVWSPFHPKVRVPRGLAWTQTGRVIIPHPDHLKELEKEEESSAGKINVFEIYTPEDISWAHRGQPLNTRAWVFQERLLSPRTLHFVSDRITWECDRSDRLTEYFRGGRDGARDLGFDTWYTERFSIGKIGYLHNFYASFVDPYTTRQLSHPNEDKLVAFAAVARRCSSWFGGEYCAGIFRNTMPWGLVWRGSKALGEPSAYRAPSWSWASVDTRVMFELIGDIRTDFAEVKDVSIQLVDQNNPFGQVKSASLTLTGPLVASERLVRPSSPEPEWNIDGPRGWANAKTVAGHDLHLEVGDLTMGHLDGESESEKGHLSYDMWLLSHQKLLLSQENTFFLAIGEATTDPPSVNMAKTFGILLKRASEGHYTRVGYWSADYGFVSQHAEKEGKFHNETITIL